MLFFVIELDEERIKKDDKINLDAAYRTIDNTFAQLNIFLYKKNGNEKWYTRNIDKNDFSCLTYANSLFKNQKWFVEYVIKWEFLDIDDTSGKVLVRDDAIESWIKNPILKGYE